VISDPDPNSKVARLRELLPATGAGIYLDTATRGPLPAETAAAMRDADEWQLRVGRATVGRAEDEAQRELEAQAVLAALLGGDTDEVSLAAGVGPALAWCALLPDWRPGDAALTLADPGAQVETALGPLQRRFGVDIDRVALDPGAIQAAVTAHTRLVVVPLVMPDSGSLVPVRLIAQAAHGAGALVVLDASLAAGALPIDAPGLGVDVLVFAADRWLLGPEATAALWRAPTVAAPPRAALGDVALSSVLGLARSVGWLEMYVGLGAVHERTRLLAGRLHEALAGAGADVVTPATEMAAMIVFRVPHWPAAQAADELRRRAHAIISTSPNGEAVRASVGWFNTEEELDRFAAAVGQLARHTPETLPARPKIELL
jgi:selenocysteine lyase/cysteine desulfurase